MSEWNMYDTSSEGKPNNNKYYFVSACSKHIVAVDSASPTTASKRAEALTRGSAPYRSETTPKLLNKRVFKHLVLLTSAWA